MMVLQFKKMKLMFFFINNVDFLGIGFTEVSLGTHIRYNPAFPLAKWVVPKEPLRDVLLCLALGEVNL